MKLQSIVPWGRSFDEYKRMFSLSERDLQSSILGCGDGPAAFNAALNGAGGRVKSVDPIYQYSAQQISWRIDEIYPQILREVEKNKSDFIWSDIASVEELGDLRMRAMQEFLADYEQGKQEGRYIEASLPKLPFKDLEFDLALCSHFLFLYTEHFSVEQHILSVKELCRVAKEVRIYPLVDLEGKLSPHINEVVKSLSDIKINLSFKKVDYCFQKGATEMLMLQNC